MKVVALDRRKEDFKMPRVLTGIAVLSLLAAFGERNVAADDPATIFLEVCQIEVDIQKLQQLGIDWKTLVEHEKVVSNPGWLRRVTELMAENGAARVSVSPRLVAVSGREARIEVSMTRLT